MAVDLELVLAVDISLSIDEDELKLQRDGYTAAFGGYGGYGGYGYGAPVVNFGIGFGGWGGGW